MAAPARGFTREQRTTIVYGILGFVVVLVVLQLWLLTATMNAFLGGDRAVILPAGLASTACLALNAGLLRYLHRLEQAAARSGARGPRLSPPHQGDACGSAGRASVQAQPPHQGDADERRRAPTMGLSDSGRRTPAP